jgi:hypothetical protein
MRKFLSVTCLAVLALSGPARADHHEGGKEAAGEAAYDQAAMEAWEKTMMPGPEHERLAFYAGEWTFVHKSWMMGDEPEVSEGSMTAEMILGGRYLKSVTKGTMSGMPMEGWSVSGYDNVTKEHFNVWLDNFGTGAMHSTGHVNDEGHVVLTGHWNDPTRGEVEYTMVSKPTGDDTYTFEMYMGEKLVMQVDYTRVKSS